MEKSDLLQQLRIDRSEERARGPGSRVWIGVLVGVNFSLWFAARESDWHQYSETWDRVLGLWCIASVLLLIVHQQDTQRQPDVVRG